MLQRDPSPHRWRAPPLSLSLTHFGFSDSSPLTAGSSLSRSFSVALLLLLRRSLALSPSLSRSQSVVSLAPAFLAKSTMSANASSRCMKPLNMWVVSSTTTLIEWPAPGENLKRFALEMVLTLSSGTVSFFPPRPPRKHRWFVVTCSCPGWLPSAHLNFFRRTEVSGRSKTRRSCSIPEAFLSRLKSTNIECMSCLSTVTSLLRPPASGSLSMPSRSEFLAMPSKRLRVLTSVVPASHLCLSAVAQSMRLLQSTTSSLDTKSLASCEIGSQYGERNLYWPALILRNIWLSLSP
mmetsp:Transcript_17688/g.38174  ORF Transcript_17688/g.38174 Transcript_17688/m.38174 type:complete len:293 (-) Transcript_17688:834-1712(-)